MASVGEEKIHKQTFNIDDLTARSVTLYPTRAAIVRDIPNVTIEPGRNEITILGLTNLADENSIKVEGHGTDALITDIVVDKRRTDCDDTSSESDSDESEPEYLEIEKLHNDLAELEQQEEDASEEMKSASLNLTYLDRNTESLSISIKGTSAFAPAAPELPTTKDMVKNLEAYNGHRANVYSKYKKGWMTLKKVRQETREKEAKIAKLEKAGWKAQREARKAAEKKRQEREEKKEQKRNRPQWSQRIRITVESDSLPVGTKFIASSVATGRPDRDEDNEPPPKSQGPSLRISYITTGVSWTPRYDLRLDTTNGTGILTYRAQFLNRTGELWRDANITLSTSQTSFSGLEDKVPWMDSWRITLQKRDVFGIDKNIGLYSKKELEARENRRKIKADAWRVSGKLVKQPQGLVPPSSGHSKPFGSVFPPAPASGSLFGNVKPSFGQPAFGAGAVTSTGNAFGAATQSQAGGLFGNMASNSNVVLPAGGAFGSASSGPPEVVAGLFGNVTINSNVAPSGGGLFGAASGAPVGVGGGFGSVAHTSFPQGTSAFGTRAGSSSNEQADTSESRIPRDREPNDDLPSDSDSDDAATLSPHRKMGLATSTSSSHGLTTTYDLPGTRTIASSDLFRRHVIAEYPLPSIQFSHTTVPKLRPVAFLKAKIRNPAPTSLLKGPVGLTLDGSFLGNGTVPRCAPGDTFELGLGIDEEVLVEYRKPIKRVASQGMLVKEQVVTYERAIRVYNARGNAVRLMVFEQVPVSEEEKLKIAILKPKGLKNVGDVVKTIASAEGSTESGKGGEVVTELRKGGEIRYEVCLEKGRGALLLLEYEARLPTGESLLCL